MEYRAPFLALLTIFLPFSSLHAVDKPASTSAPPTIKQLIQNVRERGLFIQAARAREVAARASAQKARRLPNPTLELRAENWRRSESFSAGEDLDIFATLTQPIELGGKRASRIGQAEGLSQSASAETRLVETAAILEAAGTYLGLIRIRDRIATLKDQQTELEEIVAKMRLRVAEGYSPEADLAKFQAETTLAAGLLTRAEMEEVQLSASLARVLGEEDMKLFENLPQPEIPALLNMSDEQFLQRVRDTSPAVVAARGRLRQARESLGSEKANRIPDVNLTAGYKRTGGLDTAVVGVNMPVPLFDSNASNVARAKAEEEAARADLRSEELMASLSARALLDATRLLRERAKNVDTALVASALSARDAARAAFNEGAADVLHLVDAERVYIEARGEALEIKHDAFLKTVELRLAAGEEAIP